MSVTPRLQRLPAAEQSSWRKLWGEVAVAQKKAQASFRATTRQGTLTGTKQQEVHEIALEAGQGIVIDVVLGVIGATVGGFFFQLIGGYGITGFNVFGCSTFAPK